MDYKAYLFSLPRNHYPSLFALFVSFFVCLCVFEIREKHFSNEWRFIFLAIHVIMVIPKNPFSFDLIDT
jgi:hypothetical protein